MFIRLVKRMTGMLDMLSPPLIFVFMFKSLKVFSDEVIADWSSWSVCLQAV